MSIKGSPYARFARALEVDRAAVRWVARLGLERRLGIDELRAVQQLMRKS